MIRTMDSKDKAEAWLLSKTSRQENREARGEVFTPVALVDKVLDALPRSVWSDETGKWLDPTCGVGHFLAVVYFRLMDGLEKKIPSRAKRASHILDHMLMGVELDARNAKAARKLLGECAVMRGDFLKVAGGTVSVVVGNPPFQDLFNQGHKNKLYERVLDRCFTEWTFRWMAMVVPDGLFSGNSSAFYRDVLLRNCVPLLNLDRRVDYFPGVQQPVCFFLMERRGEGKETGKGREEEGKGGKGCETRIVNHEGQEFTVTLKDRAVNPVRNWTPAIEKLLERWVGEEKNGAVYVRGAPVASYRGGRYELIYLPDGGKRLRTGKRELAPGWGVPKVVIFAISPDLAVEADFAGRYGVGPNTFYVPVRNAAEGRRVLAFLESEDYRRLALATKTTRQFLKIGLIQHLRFPVDQNGKKTRKNEKKMMTTTKTRKNKTSK